MTLPSSGPLSIGEIATEFSDAAPNSMSEFYGAGGAPASGALAVSDFYGRSSYSGASTVFRGLQSMPTVSSGKNVVMPSASAGSRGFIVHFIGLATNTFTVKAPNIYWTSLIYARNGATVPSTYDYWRLEGYLCSASRAGQTEYVQFYTTFPHRMWAAIWEVFDNVAPYGFGYYAVDQNNSSAQAALTDRLEWNNSATYPAGPNTNFVMTTMTPMVVTDIAGPNGWSADYASQNLFSGLHVRSFSGQIADSSGATPFSINSGASTYGIMVAQGYGIDPR